jgi:arginine N-succinyltransferase
LRGAGPQDLDQLLALARHLNTVNLPEDRNYLARLLDHSDASFSGRISDPRLCKYVFVVMDNELDRAVGTSTLVAQLGRKDAPYIFLDVLEEEKYWPGLDRHFEHTVLRLGFSYDGPTELAGLVLDPAYRRAPERLGLAISYVRFLFIAAHPERFQDELLAELLPPLEPDGTSHLWEAFGHRFTGMTYMEADRLSSEDKTFIRDLFPSGVVYASLFDPAAQAVIGKVGPQTVGVERMLKRAGFRYAERIDPFDGGPHFIAERQEVLPVRCTELRALRIAEELDSPELALVGLETAAPPYFRALSTAVDLGDSAQVRLTPGAAAALGAEAGTPVWVQHFRSVRS